MATTRSYLIRDRDGLIEELRDALKLADTELQKRCVILSKIREALGAAEEYLSSRPEEKHPIIFESPTQISRG